MLAALPCWCDRASPDDAAVRVRTQLWVYPGNADKMSDE